MASPTEAFFSREMEPKLQAQIKTNTTDDSIITQVR